MLLQPFNFFDRIGSIITNGDIMHPGLKARRKMVTEFWAEIARQKKKIMELKGFGNKAEALEEIKKSFV